MRITNNMIMNNSASNINDVKNLLDKTNTQMTNQQKINRPSEDPVIAVRSLRLQTTYAKTEQYYRKNIPDAESWLDVTETALINMKDVVTNMRTLAVNGATGTLTQDDRNTILTQLQALQKEIYTLGNADYAGRTVFTGYRTDKNLTFMGNESDTAYTIKQKLSASDMINTRFFSNEVEIPTSPDDVKALTDAQKTTDYNTKQDEFYKLRLAYNDINGAKDQDGNDIPAFDEAANPKFLTISYPKLDATGKQELDANGDPVFEEITPDNIKIYESEKDWEEQSGGQKSVDAKDVVIIKSTGDIIFGNDLAYEMQSNKATLDITYAKTGFLNSELRPEYYFDCTDITDPAKPVDFVKEDREYDINYTISENQTLKVNVEASTIFNHDIYQDMSDMINAVTFSIQAHDKLAKIESMMKDPNYADEETQNSLSEWKLLVQKEVDYADDNMDKLFTAQIKNGDKYLSDFNLAITRLGCTVDTLKMTEKRMSEYEENVLGLQSENDNLDLSEIIINYTAVNVAYQSSLTAAGRLYQQTLLNYI